jgi:proteasome lid subunit RPN8/RPN11
MNPSYALRGIAGGGAEADTRYAPTPITADTLSPGVDHGDQGTGHNRASDQEPTVDWPPGGDRPPSEEKTHPGPRSVSLSEELRRALIEHARREAPNEMCGVIAGTANPAAGGTATRWYPARNELASPVLYSIHPEDKLRIFLEIDDADEAFWAIVHSHVRSPAVPSRTDIGLAQWPDSLYVLVSLSDEEADPLTKEPSIRAWRIVEGAIHEVTLERPE